MKRSIAWLGRVTSALVFHSPRALQAALGMGLGSLWFDVLRIRRRVTLDNVGIAFPELGPRARARLARRSLWHLGRCFVEYAWFPRLSRSDAKDLFVFRDLEIFREALARGRGVLVLTCHLGNGDLGCAGLAMEGFPMILVSKTFKARWLNDLWFGMRERVGVRFIAPRDSSFKLLKSLKKGGAVIFPLDQFTGPPIGVRTTFFGRETGTAVGLAVMAQRSKAPVIPIFDFRRPDGRHEVQVWPEIEVGADEDPTVVTQRFNARLEDMVRAHPEQWMWIHRRWKKFKY